MFSKNAFIVFEESIIKYHILDDVYQPFENPYPSNSIEHLLYRKNWIDTVQWHYEDIIRDPEIDPLKALDLKRKIDASNQERTDMVEYIDSYFLHKYQNVSVKENATINTESPAWAVDRLSILALKIYHMNQEVLRNDATEQHKQNCQNKLDILLQQKEDLCQALDQLLYDIEQGNKYMKVYKQMKMYNDDELNPILRKK
ncbi:MAG: DUF4254 domain-containing protein [Flavobacteriaceae bacterium]|nr:DUF4254 domain-containing protein [Flavobacteriaceae bacterium]